MRVFTIPTIFTARDKFSPAVARMTRANTMFQNSFNKLAAPMRAVRDALGNIGVYLGGYVVYRAVTKFVKTIADFQQAQLEIRAVSANDIGLSTKLADNARSLALHYGTAASEIMSISLALKKMGYEDSKIGGATKAVSLGVTALTGSTPEDLANKVGAVMKIFGGRAGAMNEMQVIDTMAKAADLSAANYEDLAVAIRIAGGTFASQGKDFTELMAMMSIIKDVQVHTASGATSLKNMMAKSGIVFGKTLEESMQMVLSSPNMMKSMFKIFGPKSAVAGFGLAEAMRKDGIVMSDYEQRLDDIRKKSAGYAETVSNIKLSGLTGQFKLLSRSYDEWIFSIDSGNGAISKFLNNLTTIGRAMFLLSADTKSSREELNKLNPELINTARNFNFMAKLAGWSATILLAAAALSKLVAGITSLGTVIVAIGETMLAPLLAVGAVIGGLFLGLVDTTMQWIYSLSRIPEVFSSGGLFGLLKHFGGMLVDLVLVPLQTMLGLLDKIFGTSMALTIKEWRSNFGNEDLYADTSPLKPLSGTDAVMQKQISEMLLNIKINNNTPYDVKTNYTAPNSITPKIGSTFGGFGVYEAPLMFGR